MDREYTSPPRRVLQANSFHLSVLLTFFWRPAEEIKRKQLTCSRDFTHTMPGRNPAHLASVGAWAFHGDDSRNQLEQDSDAQEVGEL